MSDAKPFAADEVKRDNLCVPIMGESFFAFCDRLRATVEALERAEADLATCRRMLDRLVGGEGARDLMEAMALIERNAVRRAREAEAERDEWRQRCLGPVDDAEVSRVIESIQDVAKREVVVRLLRELVRERDEARAFLRRTAMTGGSIVSSAAMTATQIAIARAADRMLVTPDGYGFVYIPGPRFCACGRVESDCDQSRASCPKADPASEGDDETDIIIAGRQVP